MNHPAHFAIIGPTASGKTSLALQWARAHHGIILSIDSLAIYRDIDIASAKPTLHERGDVPHYGIDLLAPDHPFDVTDCIELYRQAHAHAMDEHRPLILVGGTGFYLKMLLEGISPLPPISDEVREDVHHRLQDVARAFDALQSLDPHYAATLQPADRYRIEKALLIYQSTGQRPSDYFQAHPPHAIIADPLPLYEILTDRAELRERIVQRTDAMLSAGLIDEVAYLERTYTRAPNSMKAIGIKEVLSYLDGVYTHEEMRQKIITNTARLAKRQVTFNKSQFGKTVRGPREDLERMLSEGGA